MYAIIDKVSNQWIFGTDYREFPHVQRTSNDQALTYETYEYAEMDFRRRGCDENNYEIVKVKLTLEVNK